MRKNERERKRARERTGSTSICQRGHIHSTEREVAPRSALSIFSKACADLYIGSLTGGPKGGGFGGGKPLGGGGGGARHCPARLTTSSIKR